MAVNITIDGKQVEAPDGALLIDVCRDNGIEIPHYCYHPGLGPDGNCRMCQVEFVSERGNRLGISCKAVVTEGMEVNTHSDAAKEARASVEEMLLLNHPLDCPICDKAGECTLQNYYMEHDLQPSRQTFTRFKKEKAVDIGPTLVLDQERCVLCDRCVRFLDDVAGDPQLYIAGRGHSAFITTFPGKEVTSPYSLNTVDLCPVGALTAKDFRFASPTWYLKNTSTVCTTCSRGCSMQLQTRDEKVYRFRPRHNPDVNGYWACDEGRLNYKFVNENRVTTARVKRGETTYEASQEEAVLQCLELMGLKPGASIEGTLPARPVVVVVSASATLEEMFLLRRVMGLLAVKVYVARHVADGVDDKLLRRADKHANAKGASLLGLEVVDLQNERAEAGTAIAKELGENGVLVTVGIHTDVSPALKGLADTAGDVIAISGCENELTESAVLVIPGATFAEKDGLVVNFEGHVQRVRAAIHRPGMNEWETLDRLVAVLRGTKPSEFVSMIRQAISEEIPAFAGMDLTDVGVTGKRVSGATVA